jgi:hypothetical protein
MAIVKYVAAIALTTSLAACVTVQNGGISVGPSMGETAQKGALSKAQRAHKKKDFEACLTHLDRAEAYGNYSRTVAAQISFNRGLCLEGMGRAEEAAAVYRNLIEKFPGSNSAVQAQERI